uniref:Uncharacterized protein n=1 Tax=viral metagenome TaxID=1070528 RepID=A0A6C0IZJ3_9ZZZZ
MTSHNRVPSKRQTTRQFIYQQIEESSADYVVGDRDAFLEKQRFIINQISLNDLAFLITIFQKNTHFRVSTSENYTDVRKCCGLYFSDDGQLVFVAK